MEMGPKALARFKKYQKEYRSKNQVNRRSYFREYARKHKNILKARSCGIKAELSIMARELSKRELEILRMERDRNKILSFVGI